MPVHSLSPMAGHDSERIARMARRGQILNESQRRVLGSGLTHLEDRLAAIAAMASSAATRSPFSPYAPDLSPAEMHLLRDYVGEIRSRMAEMAAALELDVAHGNIPTSRAVAVTLLGTEIDLAELSTETLRGYGPLALEGAAAVEQFLGELGGLLQRVRDIVSRRTNVDLSGRIAQIEHSVIDRAGLAALERVIRRRGLVTLREPLEALVERLERRSFEICVFGRVNAGKSSLLNAVLDIAALPVGVTPVTAVPTRVVFGAVEEAAIDLHNGERLRIPLTRLPEFVSEDENRDNHKGVSAVCVRVPSRHLADGIAFVDTPGLGSLATAGARAAYRYLPRADLGILLVDASGPPAREDIEVLRLLDASAIPNMVVLTKVDLLSDADRARVWEHARQRMAEALGREVPIHAVSTRGTAAALAPAWFRDVIAPLSAGGRALAEDAARRRFAALVAAARRLARREAASDAADPARADRLEALAATGERRVRDTRARCDEIAHHLRGCVPQAFEAAARVAADHILADDDWSVVGPAAAAALEAAAERAGDEVQEALLCLRQELQDLLGRAAAVAGGRLVPEGLRIDAVSRPRAAVPAEIYALACPRSRWIRHSKRLLQARILRCLGEQVDRSAADVVAQASVELHRWSGQVLEALKRQFTAELDPLRAMARVGAQPSPAVEGSDEADDRDLDALERLGALLDSGPESSSGPPPRGPRSGEVDRCSPAR